MKVYKTSDIRNVGFFGHGSTGKTTACEAMLYNTKGTDRFGKVTEGNTVSDHDPDEIKRGMSIYTTTIPVEYREKKINILDTPGFLDFVAQVKSALRVVESGVFFVSAQAGVEVGLERVWKMAQDHKITRTFFINKLDKENSNFEKAVQSIRDNLKLEGSLVVTQLPIGVAENFKGIVDLIQMCAFTFKDGKPTKIDIPDELSDKVEEYREKLVEAAAGADEEMIEKFFEGELTDEDIHKGLARGIKEGTIMPVLCGSAQKNMGMQLLLDAMVNFLPAPDQLGDFKAKKPKSDEEIVVKPSPEEPVSALIFKTTTDPYVGQLSVMRIYSGTLTPDTILFNPNKQADEKISGLMVFRGKDYENVEKALAGDIITVAKLAHSGTNDTLCSKDRPVQFKPIDFPKPLMSMAVYPKSKGDEDKLSNGMSKLADEDPTFEVHRDSVTKETVVSGVGDLQLNIIMDRLKRKFGVEVDLVEPRVPYKETIKGSAKSEYKHKKQSGGRGQYGHVYLQLDPLPRGEGYEFVDKIVGGAIPRNYIPAVDKGIRSAMEEGVLAGYPVVDVRVTLYDGSFHTVDSSDLAFQIAGSMAFKKGMPMANPILLEPIYELEVIVSDSFMGDVIGDLNSRRGRILGMTPLGDGMQSIKATVPLAEVLKYSIDLRSITQGRGEFNMKFSTYEEVPSQLAEQIIAAARQEEES